jgi:hypothetical protein
MPQDKVMLLIDADNVSLDVIEQAVAWVAKHYGGPHVRRAYCTAESAVKHQSAFKRLGIRPMVNLAAGKNSTDIALAVDAIDLTLAERPQVVVIASSDSDFAPLVGRLREKGSLVVGIGQRGKTGDETRSVYDDYEVMEHHRRGGAGAAVRPPQEPAPSANAASGRRSRRRSGQRQGAGAQAGPEGQPVTGAPAAAAPTLGLMGAPVPARPLPSVRPEISPSPARGEGGRGRRRDRARPAGEGGQARASSPSPLAGEGSERGGSADTPASAPLSPSPSPARGEGGRARRRDRARPAGEGGQPGVSSPSASAGEGSGTGGNTDAPVSASVAQEPPAAPARKPRRRRPAAKATPAGSDPGPTTP